MTNKEVADRLVTLLREGRFNEVYDELFHVDAEHIEPQSEHFAQVKGVAAIKAKDAVMQENISGVEGLEVGDAIVSKGHIALPYRMTVTLKDGNKWPLDEIIVYKVNDGKIVSEQFFY
ncbi:nuclear transport factor 2 family protein [Ulvibacterium marinum]|uniref:Nuclear transport factor 2 family protein n=1 Tax=Ulvibacterium marinum TaxID=2419782 RepID=A0A3B0CD52_9FLAO|nr:nuclear transport factor 2 family protein [Ulvibacterium marinum]RKN82548.1 nuclear transport factor 2 family protein [Ulvibacterium marinum]